MRRLLTVQGWRWWASCRWWSACPARHRRWWRRGMSGGRCSESQWRGSASQSGAPTSAPRWRNGFEAPCRSSSSCWSGCRHRHSTGWCRTCVSVVQSFTYSNDECILLYQLTHLIICGTETLLFSSKAFIIRPLQRMLSIHWERRWRQRNGSNQSANSSPKQVSTSFHFYNLSRNVIHCTSCNICGCFLNAENNLLH